MGTNDIPEKIGRYKPVRLLGRGGMGVVWLALDPFIGRSVAIKATLTPPPTDPEELEQFNNNFFREAHGAGRLSHPNIVYVYDATVDQDKCYLVLEYVDGPTLKKLCRRENKLPAKTVINIIFQCAKALYYAHQNGVIHRDIKPANIMIDRKKKQAKITDFGIAALEGLTRLEKRGQTALTIHYASPEQLARKPLNAQTDIFSLGVVMYELLTGARPFEAETEIGAVYKITHEPPTPIKNFRDDLPEALEKIVYKALEKDLSARYLDCRELAADLSQYFIDLTKTEKEISLAEKHHALKRIAFFKDFSPLELDEVAGFTRWVDFNDEETIIIEGDIQDFFLHHHFGAGADFQKKPNPGHARTRHLFRRNGLPGQNQKNRPRSGRGTDRPHEARSQRHRSGLGQYTASLL